MIIRLYQQSASEAFRLTVTALQRLGFTLYFADSRKGMIRTGRKLISTEQIIFFDVQITHAHNVVSLSLISNIFSESTCTFIADAVSEELFLEALHDLMRIQLPDNPLKLSKNDYAMSAFCT